MDKTAMNHDREYFRRRAAEARGAASRTDEVQSVEVAGDLARAYAALARRRAAAPAPPADPDTRPAIPLPTT